MICPLMSKKWQDIHQGMEVTCLKEKCAWWVKTDEVIHSSQCAIKLLAEKER